MSMATMTRRLQVLLDEERYRRLEQAARRRRSSVATLVRDALDRTYGLQGPDATEAADRFLARLPLDVGDWTEAKRDIAGAYERAPDAQ
jgi:hypothetical protein